MRRYYVVTAFTTTRGASQATEANMSTPRVVAIHVLDAVALGAFVVAMPVGLNLAVFMIWAVVVAVWVTRQTRTHGPRSGAAELVTQLATMSVMVLAATWAPVKVVERVKARRVTLPRQAMTIGELRDPKTAEVPYILRDSLNATDDMAPRIVRFPARDLTVGEVITAIEAQTPLRHQFRHCGNGSTILWGGDCSFGLSFDVPPRSALTTIDRGPENQ
jgi:hypothetical protein